MKIDQDPHNRQKIVKGWNQQAVSEAKVAVIGAGALGNEVMKLLLQMGVREVCLVDFDTIVPANLNRCVFFTQQDVNKPKAEVIAVKAKHAYPDSHVVPLLKKAEDLSENFWGAQDFVFSCLDSLGARLFVNAQNYGKATLIDGGTTAFSGKVQVVKAPSSCLECGVSKSDYDRLWQKYNCIGEPVDWMDPKSPALGSTTSIVAAVQVNEFVKELHENPSLAGKYWFFDGLKAKSEVFEVPKRKNCPAHA
jgi:molybdopterin/thiamine biosynthesis adenylyltransferase